MTRVARLILAAALSALVLAFCVTAASAQSARVLSGEHGDFTRLVIELPDPMDWTLGRTPEGYAFAARTATQPDYDLARVWERIARTRLQALQRDPATGALELLLGCECHVFPFEYQPGIVVLDIKPGPAPAGSVFEADFPQPDAEPARGGPTTALYDWRALATSARAKPDAAVLPLPLDTGEISLQPLRDELLEQIARGAADGVVTMELPGKPQRVPPTDHGDLPWSEIHLGEQPGIRVFDPDAFEEASEPMAACTPDELLDLASWGADLLPSELLASTRQGLYGEFDLPDPETVKTSVKGLIYLGFGAEALQQAAFLDAGSAPDELALYRSMARLVDLETDPKTPFSAMLDCDGPAALWAALARDRLPPGAGVNRDAILRAYLALPSHLRRHLGPGLAEKFLAVGDAEAGRVIRDAIERSPQADPAQLALLDASAELHGGNADAALDHAQTAVALDGDNAEGLVTLVEAHLRKLEPLEPAVAEALAALQSEVEGSAKGASVDRALVLALALSGQTDAAFAEADGKVDVLADLWQVAKERATDDDFLRRAILSDADPRPPVAADVATGISERLVSLGFPDAALRWIGPVSAADAPELRLVAARAEQARGDARAALRLLDGLADPKAEALRAEANVQLGAFAAARQSLAAAGDAEAASRIGLWQQDWAGLDPETPEAWRAAASLATAAPDASAPGPLARGGKAAEESLAVRTAVEALLATVPSPSDG